MTVPFIPVGQVLRVLGLALVANAACLAGFVVFADEQAPLPQPSLVAATVTTEPSEAEALMRRHGCWSDEAPADMAGELPGHVVTDRGYGGWRLVGLALEQTFDGVDHGLAVHGYCR